MARADSSPPARAIFSWVDRLAVVVRIGRKSRAGLVEGKDAKGVGNRYVSRTGKDEANEITLLCSPGAYWSPKTRQAAIRQIEAGSHRYWISQEGVTVLIEVAEGPRGKILHAKGRTGSVNGLRDLPNC